MESTMVRGCEKRIYHVKNPESELFDEAYLILRRGARTSAATPREIELEAMRILRGSDRSQPKSTQRKLGSLKSFFLGAALSAALIGGLSILLWLVM
ncbi:MAG: hypothetical protein IJ457_02160 [Clostridia bacterium]|nr:hypothetical protein [Clostridia bacterium]